MGNTTLMNARLKKNDEFYTLYNDIASELQYYTMFLKGKSIFLPCDSETSNFWKYFLNEFSNLQLKKLGRSSLEKEYVETNSNTTTYHFLTNGDFFQDEVKAIMRQYDLIITNPPFSTLKDFIFMLEEMQLKYILIANPTVLVAYKIFPFIKNEIIHTGYTPIKEFNTPENIRKPVKSCWITNLPIQKKATITLSCEYSAEKYPKFENYDAINVDKVKDIPKDYDGVMGVPITYLTKHNSAMFKILGYAGGVTKMHGLNYDVSYTPRPDDRGGNPIVNGVYKYGRIFI